MRGSLCLDVRLPSQASAQDAVTRALKAHLASVRRITPARWTCALEGARRSLSASLDGGWLVLDVPAEAFARQASGPELLHWSACLPPPVKWVRDPGCEARLRAEIPLDSLDDGEEVIGSACAALLQAARQDAAGFCIADTDSEAGPGVGLDVDLQALCEELDLPRRRSSGDEPCIGLDVPGESWSARIESLGPNDVLFVELVPAMEALAPAARTAVAMLLLACAWHIRAVRSVARGPEGGGAAGLEVPWTAPPDARQLESALTCLSVACASCGREALAVQQESIARQYLAAQGMGVPVLV
jgi:hypothetical protein